MLRKRKTHRFNSSLWQSFSLKFLHGVISSMVEILFQMNQWTIAKTEVNNNNICTRKFLSKLYRFVVALIYGKIAVHKTFGAPYFSTHSSNNTYKCNYKSIFYTAKLSIIQSNRKTKSELFYSFAFPLQSVSSSERDVHLQSYYMLLLKIISQL